MLDVVVSRDVMSLITEDGRVLTVQSAMMLHPMATLLENLPLIIEGLVRGNEFVSMDRIKCDNDTDLKISG